MAFWAIDNSMTIERFAHLFDRVPYRILDPGTPIALGVVPLVFSTLLFAVPLVRALLRPWRERRASEDRGRLPVLPGGGERGPPQKPLTHPGVPRARPPAP